MALAELGGLGQNEGPGLNYHWEPPSLIAPLLPWLAVLLLLGIRPNRNPQAWWILVPLVFVSGLAAVVQLVLNSLPSSELSDLFEVIAALAFGIGAVWLVSPWLRRSHRLLTFLLTLVVQAGFSVLALFAGRGFEVDNGQNWSEALALLTGAFVLSLALSLAGLLCRRRYSRVRFSLWLAFFTLASWLSVLGPFCIVALAGGQGGPTAGEFLIVLLAVTGVALGTLLPFLVLSFANGFHHERLKALLHAGQMPAPPVIDRAGVVPAPT